MARNNTANQFRMLALEVFAIAGCAMLSATQTGNWRRVRRDGAKAPSSGEPTY
jgi:hypothetical protein